MLDKFSLRAYKGLQVSLKLSLTSISIFGGACRPRIFLCRVDKTIRQGDLTSDQDLFVVVHNAAHDAAGNSRILVNEVCLGANHNFTRAYAVKFGGYDEVLEGTVVKFPTTRRDPELGIFVVERRVEYDGVESARSVTVMLLLEERPSVNVEREAIAQPAEAWRKESLMVQDCV